MRWRLPLPILACSALLCASPLWSDGVAVHNGSTVAWRIQPNPAHGEGRYFAYLEEPGEEASRGVPYAEPPDWMDIDFATAGLRRDIVLEPGQTLRLELIGNGTLQEGFALVDGALRRRGAFVVSRRAPKAGRPFATDLFFSQRNARGLVAYQFEWDARQLRILDPAGAGPEPRGALPGGLGGAGSAFRSVSWRESGGVETKEERKGPPAREADK